MKEGVSKYWFKLKPFNCPYCNANIILDKQAHVYLWGSIIFYNFVIILHWTLKLFSIQNNKFDQFYTYIGFGVLVFMVIGAAKYKVNKYTS